MTAKDDRTLVVELENPTPYLLELVAFMTYMPVRGDIVSAAPEKWALSAKTYIGNGPYVMTEYTPEGIVLEKNLEYWNAAGVRLQRVECSFINEASTEMAAFENGELDILENIPSAELKRVSKMDGFVVYPQMTSYFYTLNTEKYPLDDVRVRRALALAVDRKALVDSVAQGVGQPAANVVPPSLKDSKRNDFSATAGYFGRAPDGSAKPDEARKLLADAGYAGGKGFPELSLFYNTNDSVKQLAEAVQEMWRRELGINVKLVNQERPVFMDKRKAGSYEIARGYWWGDYADPMTFLDMLISSSGTNWPRWRNAEYDKLISESALRRGEARDESMYAANLLFMSDMPVVPLYYPMDDYVIPPRVKGVERTPNSILYFGGVEMAK